MRAHHLSADSSQTLFSGVLVGIIHNFLGLLKTLLKERTAEMFSCCFGVSRNQADAQQKKDREKHLCVFEDRLEVSC